jgi:glucose-1-phosphate thymidylyltransferase
MKAIILAGGYAKRLVPFFGAPVPKALLPVGKRLLLTYIVEKVAELPEVDQLVVSTNMKFEKPFTEWLRGSSFPKPVKLLVEPTSSEDKKLGAVGGIDYAIKNAKISDDLMVIAGDNLFAFALPDFLKFYSSKKAPVVAVHDIADLEKARLYGVVKLGKSGKIDEFHEKPDSPPSTLISTACYIFPKSSLKLLNEYMSGGNHADRLGDFVRWLLGKTEVFAYAFQEEWFDIGDVDSLSRAREWIKGRED